MSYQKTMSLFSEMNNLELFLKSFIYKEHKHTHTFT